MKSDTEDKTRRTSPQRLFVLVVVAAIAVLSLLSYLIWSSYQEAIRLAESTTRNEAAILAVRLDDVLRRADSDLKEVVRKMPVAALDKSAARRYAGEWDAEFDLRMVDFPELEGFRVFDAGGDLIYTSGRKTVPAVNIADRKHFRALRDDPADRLVFSEVLVARTTGAKSIIIARSFHDRNGGFRGVITAPLKLDYFLNLFQTLQTGPGGVIAIYRSDLFTQVLRLPPNDAQLNVALPPNTPTRVAFSGGARTLTSDITAVDGVTRIYTNHRLDHYPFFVGVGVSRADATASWRERSILVGFSVVAAMGLLIGLLVRLRRAEDDLVKSGAELENRVQNRTAVLEFFVQELKAANKALDAANKEAEAFAYSVSHDLRTPVGVVSNFTHLLRTGEDARLSDDGKHLISVIEQNAERMVHLIDGLLNMSRLGRSPIRHVPLSMAGLAKDAVQANKGTSTAGTANAEIQVEDIPDCEGDPALIAQVWANLVGNAFKYSKVRDPARIEIGWDKAKQAYFVRDNGIGFDMQFAGKLFGAFERLHSDPQFEGSGIGLAIVRRIIERHGGTIWAEASVNQGATFWFTL